jgi:hypothetical protein
MPHCLPAAFLKTVFTYVAVAKERSCRAEEPVIVERLDHGYTQVPAGVVGRRRDQRKRIVEMDDVRPAVLKQPMQFIPGGGGPNSPETQRNIGTNASGVNFIIMAKVFVNFVPGSEKKGFFRADGRVFTTRLLVSIVSDENFQE